LNNVETYQDENQKNHPTKVNVKTKPSTMAIPISEPETKEHLTLQLPKDGPLKKK
jgi:hypothetical protein